MMEPNIHRIILKCKEIDFLAYETYIKISKYCKKKEVSKFFKKMSFEEKSHILFWEKLETLSNQGFIPQVFSNPEIIFKELNELLLKSKKLQHLIVEDIQVQTAFLIAFKLEFYFLHPAIEVLFHYIKTFDSEVNPGDTYENHIREFIIALKKYGNSSPELELVGETLGKLWAENRKLASTMMIDDLTKIFNRRGFYDAIIPLCHLSFRSKMEVAFFMIDIDDFKKINDKFGHKKGDEIITTIASLLKVSIRKSDVVGRMGGEEFVVFATNIHENNIAAMATNILETIVKHTKNIVPTTVSIGISTGMFSKDIEKDIEDLIKKADENMYKAKEMGKNRFFIS